MERGGRHPYFSVSRPGGTTICRWRRRPSFLGVVKTNIGIKDGRIAGIGRAGSPDISDGIELQIGPDTWPRRSRPPVASVSMESTSDGCSGRSFEIELEQLPQPF
jgi:hypothetical protein